jgi:hypothetical protein
LLRFSFEGINAVHKIIHVQIFEGYRLRLVFDNDKSGFVDLSRLAGKGVFAMWLDYEIFQEVRIGSSGELIWDNRVALCPDALYMEATHQRPEDVFLLLQQGPQYA